MKGQRKQNRWAGALVGLWLSVGSAPAWAFTVESTADSGGTCPGATCTLRQAIVDTPANGTIDFSVTGTITLDSQLTLNKNLTITGPGAAQLAISGNNTVRVMAVTAGVTVTISDLTIQNGGSVTGGGINNSGTVTVSTSTFSGNSAPQGGGIYNNTGTVNVRGTIIANSPSGGNCAATAPTSQGDNISSDGTCVATSVPLNDRNNTDPLLNALANNGGPTETFALQNTSPAVNTLTVTAGTCPKTDQRGEPRPIGPFCDIGAFESAVVPVELQEFVVE